MANDAAVTGNHEPETVPRDPAFITADEGAESDDPADHDRQPEPPETCDRLVHAKENPRRQRKGATILRHEADQLRYHESNDERDERDAGQREKQRITHRLLDAVEH